MELWIYIIPLTLLIMLTGIPIAYCLGIAGFLGVAGNIGIDAAGFLMGQIVFESAFSYELSVLPIFILMGNLITEAKLSDDLFNAANTIIGHKRGGIGMATAVSAGGLSAVCGSSLATAATMSKVAMPSMRRFGYNDGLATGVIAAGGTLGILIPPSVVLIIYAIMTEQDISEMFLAGVLPGILGVLGYMTVVRLVTSFRPKYGPPGNKSSWTEKLNALKKVIDFIVLFMVVMGGIYLGIFTSTEAAGIGAAAAMFFVWKRGNLSWRVLKKSLADTGKTTVMLFTIYIGAQFFTEFINYSALPDTLESTINYFQLGSFGVVVAILTVCLILGTFMEAMSIILLIVPLALPILSMLEVNLVWFGILLVVTSEISLITPPVGMNVFVLRAINSDIALPTIFKGVLPFIAMDFCRLFLLLLIPWFSLALL